MSPAIRIALFIVGLAGLSLCLVIVTGPPWTAAMAIATLVLDLLSVMCLLFALSRP